MDAFNRRMGRATRRENKFYEKSDRRLDGIREMRMAGAIFGNRGPYRGGMAMGFNFLHEDGFGPDDDYGSIDPISSSSGPGDYSFDGSE